MLLHLAQSEIVAITKVICTDRFSMVLQWSGGEGQGERMQLQHKLWPIVVCWGEEMFFHPILIMKCLIFQNWFSFSAKKCLKKKKVSTRKAHKSFWKEITPKTVKCESDVDIFIWSTELSLCICAWKYSAIKMEVWLELEAGVWIQKSLIYIESIYSSVLDSKHRMFGVSGFLKGKKGEGGGEYRRS